MNIKISILSLSTLAFIAACNNTAMTQKGQSLALKGNDNFKTLMAQGAGNFRPEAIIKYNGVTSPRYKLEAESGLATITAPNLLTAKSDTLVVEIYEAEKLRFIARRIATTVEKGKANSWKLEDCLVTKVPWDGEKNEGSCGWTVQDVK